MTHYNIIEKMQDRGKAKKPKTEKNQVDKALKEIEEKLKEGKDDKNK